MGHPRDDELWYGQLAKEREERIRAAAPDLLAALQECVIELECMVEHHYAGTKDHPAMALRYERDMEPVKAAHAVIAKAEGRNVRE